MQARKNPVPRVSGSNFYNNKNAINKNGNNSNIGGRLSPRDQKKILPPQPPLKKQLSD